MAYEKYIKKDGKLYGPYLYHSRRVDGKVISEYHSKKKIGYGKILGISLAFLLIAFGAYLIGQRNDKLTGYSVLDLNANYQEGKNLNGGIKLSLQEGELIPASSSVVFENGEKKYEYPLKDLILESPEEGNFFFKEKNISGSGQGFGISGTKEVHPEIYFILLISSPQADSGDGITESEKEVQGIVSAENPFTYSLQEGERAEIKPRSMRTSSGQLPEDSLSLTTEGNLVSVSTTYSEKEKGFGSDYFGSKVKEFTINLDKLNLLLEKGTLKVGIFYEGQNLVSLETNVDNKTVSTETEIVSPVIPQVPEQTTSETSKNETTSTNQTSSQPERTTEISVVNYAKELTAEERSALQKEFGNISLEVKEEKTKNGFTIIRYELREDTWVNYSYSSDLGNDTLSNFIQQDKIKWLKDLAKKYSA